MRHLVFASPLTSVLKLEAFTLFIISTGIITGSMLVQFIFPRKTLQVLHKTTVSKDSALFFAGHWGLMCFVVGALLVFAGFFEVYRPPILLAAAIEKAGLIFIIIKNRNKPFYKSLYPTAAFDGLCVLVYAYYLLTSV